MFNKRIIITDHAIERFEERRRPTANKPLIKKWYADQRKFLVNELRPLNIRTLSKKDGVTIATTKQGYRFIIKETPTTAIVKTVIKISNKY